MEKMLEKSKNVIEEKWNAGFRKMTVEKKLRLLDDFFLFGKKLQTLNDRRKKEAVLK